MECRKIGARWEYYFNGRWMQIGELVEEAQRFHPEGIKKDTLTGRIVKYRNGIYHYNDLEECLSEPVKKGFGGKPRKPDVRRKIRDEFVNVLNMFPVGVTK